MAVVDVSTFPVPAVPGPTPPARLTTSFRIEGMTPTIVEPFHVRMQVRYWIDPSAPGPYFLGARVDAWDARGFSYVPAGRLPGGVPKGSVALTDAAAVDVWYGGDDECISTAVEIFIYDATGKRQASTVVRWGQAWRGRLDRSIH